MLSRRSVKVGVVPVGGEAEPKPEKPKSKNPHHVFASVVAKSCVAVDVTPVPVPPQRISGDVPSPP